MQHKTNQVHDFNPGFGNPVNAAGDRTCWTVPIPASDIRSDDLRTGKAEMRVTNLHIEDYFNLANALRDGHSIEATVAFDVVWGGDATRRVDIRDTTTGFEGRFKEESATVVFAAQEDGFTFVSNPANTSSSAFAQLGQERNGNFFL